MKNKLLLRLIFIGGLTIAMISYFAYWQSNHMKKIARLYAENIQIQKEGQELKEHIKLLEMSARMSAMSGEESWENNFETELELFNHLAIKLEGYFRDEELSQLKNSVKAFHLMASDIFTKIRTSHDEEAKILSHSLDFEVKTEELHESLDKFEEITSLKTNQLWKEINSSYVPLKAFILFLVFFVSLLLVMAAHAILNWTNHLNGMNERLSKLVEDKTQEIKEQSSQLLFNSKLATMGEISAGIGHEINNPLAAIITTSSILEKIVDRPEIDIGKAKEQIARIRNMADRISKIVRGLKSLSRNDSIELKADTKLLDILENVYILIDHRFHYEGVTFKKNIAPDILIECNETQITQVLVNLIGNAIDAVSKEDKSWVEISFESLDEAFCISIANSGNKIPKDIQEKIFSSFFTTKEKGKGTGLGLPLSKKIMESHGGRLFLDDQKAYTTFMILFPNELIKKEGLV